MEKSEPARIPEDRVSAILKRAAELDRKVQESVELDAIRAAAVEAGISLAAVDRALEEYAAGTVTAAPAVTVAAPQKRGWRHWWDRLHEPIKLNDIVTYSGLGVLSGWVAALGEAGIVVPMIALVLAALRIVLQDRPTARARRFLQNLSAMTLATLIAYMSTGEADEDVVAYIMMVGVTLIPLGVLVIKTQARKPQSLEEVESTS